MIRDAQFQDRVAIVTGGSRGIGLAVASALGVRGARVTIAGRFAAGLDRARHHIESAAGAPDGSGATVESVVLDVRDSAAITRTVDDVARRSGGLDILINNAGVGAFGEVADFPIEDWHRIMETNLTAVFCACRAAIPHLRRRGGGWIVNVSSLAGVNPFRGGAAYCASKAGLDAFTHALMQEVRHDGIRVSTIAPGSVQTGFGGAASSGADWKLMPEDVAQIVVDLIAHQTRSLPSRVELRPSMPRSS